MGLFSAAPTCPEGTWPESANSTLVSGLQAGMARSLGSTPQRLHALTRTRQPYRQELQKMIAAFVANVGDDDATDIADLDTAVGASTAVASSGVDTGEMESTPTTVVARWSKPVELRPCTTLVVQNNIVLPNGRLSLEDTLDDTLDALGLQDDLPDTEDFQSCDTTWTTKAVQFF